jgi:DNA polymerase elongation subunit (family B)
MDDFRNILFLDIETVACSPAYAELSERLKVQWARKANYFRQRDNELTDEELFHERAGIYAEFGKVVVIAMGKFSVNEAGERTLRTRSLAHDDEGTLLREFCSVLGKMDQSQVRFCAHNGKEFDYPYLSRRLLVQGIPLPESLNLSGKKPWEIGHLDTLEMWKFGDYKHYTSLDLLATLFDIPTSKGDMDGSKVNEVYYREKDLKKIAEYCTSDVVVVSQLFLRLKGQPLVEKRNILIG